MAAVNDFELGKDGSYRTGRRFHKDANMQYTVESIDGLLNDTNELSAIIKHHTEYQKPRLDELDDYYLGDNTTITQQKRRKEEDKADHRAKHNYAKYVSNFMQGFLVGVPIAITHDDTETKKKIDEINEVIEAPALNADLILDLSVYGRAYELLHRNQEDETKVYLSSPLETFLIYDNTIEKKVLAGVRYFNIGYGDKVKTKVILYTDKKMYTYLTSDFTSFKLELEDGGEKDHPFSEVPINEHSNNRFRQGDFENVLDLIDLYDAAQSDTANYMTDLNDAMLAIIGNVELGIEEAKGMKEANILLAKPGANSDGRESNVSADYIYKKYDVAGSEAYKDRIQNDIHKFTNTPDMNQTKTGEQAQSGEALKYKLFGLEQIRINKERLFKRSLNRRYKLINNIMETASEATAGEFEGITYKFTPNLPKSTKEAMEIFNGAAGELSQETKLKIIPMIVEDPQEEIKRIEAERSKQREPSRNVQN